MRSGTRLRALPCNTQRYRKSFIPNSIHIIIKQIHVNLLIFLGHLKFLNATNVCICILVKVLSMCIRIPVSLLWVNKQCLHSYGGYNESRHWSDDIYDLLIILFSYTWNVWWISSQAQILLWYMYNKMSLKAMLLSIASRTSTEMNTHTKWN
jgi:hypothetical protein